MKANNAIEWHSQIANGFALNYQYCKRFIERYNIWTKIITKYSNPNNLVLDIGCGSGVFSFYAAERNRRVIGIDASDKMINICEQRKAQSDINNIDFYNTEICYLNTLVNEGADLIICSSVLEYVDDLYVAIDILSHSIKKTGIFVLSMPNKSSIYRNIESVIFKLTGRPLYYKYVKNVVSLDKLSAKLINSGFCILESSYYSATPLLSKLCYIVGLSKYSDNLFIIVARRSG